MRCVLGVFLLWGFNAMAEPADLILRGGEVVTGDPARPRARAVAVRGGTIAAVGDDADVKGLVGKGTRVIELRGRAVVASLTDAHAHLSSLGLSRQQVELSGC